MECCITHAEKKKKYYDAHKEHICEVERLRHERNRPDDLKKLGRYISKDELEEKWRKIPDHPDYYASPEGEITGKWRRIMIGHTDRCGYKEVILREKGQNVQCLAHRLIASAFLEKPEGKDYINHKDGNKENNRIDNLEWVTKSENTLHSFDMGLQKTIHGTKLIRGERLQFIKDNLQAMTNEEIAEILECKPDTIRKYRYSINKGEI